MTIILAIYYNMIAGWSLYYFVMSIRSKLPWECCEKPWASENCVSLNAAKCGENVTNITSAFGSESTAVLAGDDYYHNQILRISDDFTQVGSTAELLQLSYTPVKLRIKATNKRRLFSRRTLPKAFSTVDLVDQ